MKYEYKLIKTENKYKKRVDDIIKEYKKANLEADDWFSLGDLFYKLYCKKGEQKPTCPFCNNSLMWVEEMEGDCAGYHFQCENCHTTLTLQLDEECEEFNKVCIFCKSS